MKQYNKSREEITLCHCGVCSKCGKIVPMDYYQERHKTLHLHKGEECKCR